MEELKQLFGHTRLDMLAVIASIIAMIGQLMYIGAIIWKGAKPAISSVALWVIFSILTTWGQAKTGSLLPQTMVYLMTDPFILCAALFVGRWSPYEKEDKIAIILGTIGAFTLAFLGDTSSGLGFILIWIGINATIIPLIKNILKDPFSENPEAWAILAVAGMFSLASSIVHFNSYWDLLSPIMYVLGSMTLLILIIRGRLSRSLNIIQSIDA